MNKHTPEELVELLKDKARLDWLADVNNSVGNVQLPRDIVERNLEPASPLAFLSFIE